MAATPIPRRVPEFHLEQLDDELLLYHPGLTKAIHLNPTASLIWQLCDGVRSSNEIAVMLSEVYGADADIGADVDATLDRLVAEGVLTLASPA